MVLAKVTNENLIAGLLLKYKRINNVDIDIYREILLEKYGYRLSPFAVDIRGIVNCIIQVNNSYYMIDNIDTINLLGEKQGEVFPNILEEIDIEEVVLRKIAKLGSILEYLIPSIFSDEEERVINKLLDDMSLIYVWSDNTYNAEERELQLTSIGIERLKTFKEEIKNDKHL